MRKSAKIIAALSVAGLAVAAGSAFTGANLAPLTAVVGYSTTEVSGATVSSIGYVTTSNGTEIDSVNLVLLGDTSDSQVLLGLNNVDPTACDVTSALEATDTTYNCNPTNIDTSTLTSTAIVVN